ncbi:MAG TPA: response regulator transcription factor [Ramlibacter sp.]|nr:response regulator transcription factor [Ramlibacter sp.]
MRVLVVDDHALFREGLRLLLLSQPGLACEVAASADAGLQLARSGPDYDVVLLDWHMEGLSGADAIRAFREVAQESRIVVVSAEKSAGLVRAAVEAGAAGFIPKESSPEVLEQALQKIAAGGIYLPSALLASGGESQRPAGAGPRTLDAAFPGLTPRQIDVLAAVLKGVSNKVIARQLGISDATVKSHLSVIFRELSVQSRTEAVYVAARQGVSIA